MVQDPSDQWFSEVITPDMSMLTRIKESHYSGRTRFQKVEVIETTTSGRALILDGKTQSSEADEHIYHEALVHPPMLTHPNPRKVFIGGGGEGATLREVLYHKSVERVVMVDLDEKVVEISRKFLPNHSKGAFEDPRIELFHTDARKYLEDTDEIFDVIILDLVDPLEAGVAYKLYTQEFYSIVRSKLGSSGVMVTQSGPAGLMNYHECFTPIIKTLQNTFTNVLPYNIFVPCFVSMWGFTIGTDISPIVAPDQRNPLIAKRLSNNLRFYDQISHQHMFSLPPYIRYGIDNEQQIITDENPVFMV
jgi:spermidine synthase